ncbi:mediator of RNA polymerase II transcription subunit 10b [Chlorella sorokiniana]|uniref:Mediator of RNA polymerase II transcription subunit 10 n=1 Tax=Chlorella sorokiniana TaxID=3076 RepID=A0A2P6TH05_CHLSO|nr:mediator of RNA polymerase II transcription subunit 10b [Chlorella sorokiniana]|eukprot:PRW33561.1 mediator of RNA polymerase II transcription subunit 10b [Chlorella sorokiniana]
MSAPPSEAARRKNVQDAIDRVLFKINELEAILGNFTGQNDLLHAKLNEYVAELGKLEAAKDDMIGGGQPVELAVELLRAVDEGTNPDSFTVQLFRDSLAQNQASKGKVEAFRTLREQLTQQLAAAFPATRAARALAAACLTATSLPDCRFGLLAAAMWGTWAWKLVPHATLLDNAQSVAGLVAIVAVSLLWPTVHPASFQRRRTLALASLRLFLLCLPFNFSQRVLDLALPQQLESGRLAPLVNLSHLISASHLDFLLFTGLGWRLPLRPHMALQGLKLAILARFGVHAHCRGMLLSSPEVQQLAARAHGVMSIAAGALAPGATTALLEPREPYMQVVALLLLAWVLLGWLVPTLLLLPPAAPAASAWEQAVPQYHTARQALAGG